MSQEGAESICQLLLMVHNCPSLDTSLVIHSTFLWVTLSIESRSLIRQLLFAGVIQPLWSSPILPDDGGRGSCSWCFPSEQQCNGYVLHYAALGWCRHLRSDERSPLLHQPACPDVGVS